MDLFDNLTDKDIWYYLDTDNMTLENLDGCWETFNYKGDDFKAIQMFQEFMITEITKIDQENLHDASIMITFTYNDYKIKYWKTYSSIDDNIYILTEFDIKIKGVKITFDTYEGAKIIRDYILNGSKGKRVQ